MAVILVPVHDEFSGMDPQSLNVSQGKKLRNVVLFEREDVRVMENGDVLTESLSEIDRIKRKPGRFMTRLNFPRGMTSDDVRSVLEVNFPLLKNRRFSCAARGTQNSAKLDFHGDRRVWDGETINRRLKGSSVLYLVMEDEPPVSREVSSRTESASSMQGHSSHSCHNSNNSVNYQQLLPQSATVGFSGDANCNTKANVEDKSNLDVEIPLSPFFNGSLDCEQFMDEDLPQLPADYIDDLLDGMDSTQRNSQSQTTQGESFAPSAGFENCWSGLGSTVQTRSPMTLPAVNYDWNGTDGAMPPIAPVLALSQPHHNQVSEARSTYTDTDGPSDSGFSSEDCGFASDDLLDGMDSTQRNGQSQISQGESFPLSADFENCCSSRLTVQTSRPMSSPAFNNHWYRTVGVMPPIAAVPAPSQAFQNQVSEDCSTNIDTSGPSESGFSSEGNSSIDGQALDLPQSIPPEASVEVKPSKGPLEGGGVFHLKFDQSLPDAVTSAWAIFGNKQVEVRKTHECSSILHGENIPAGDIAGTVTVTITTKNGDYLGETSFTYVDQEEEMLMQIINSKRLQRKLFTMLGKQGENDESEENNSRTFGLPSDGRQRQAMDLLRCLVYTAARIGAEEFIRMIFSTSAGRIVFEAYKKESTLPEDKADENGHEGIATFLRAITKSFSEEDTSHMQSGGINWRNLARAVEESDEQSVSWSYEKHVKQLKEDDLSEREYFGDAETSSSDSEEERCHYEDQFEARFSKDQDAGQMGLDPNHQMTERDIYKYQLPEKIGGRWRDLARALRYREASINRIQKNQGGSTKECCFEVLVRWIDREEQNATVEKLAEALVKAELKNIAGELICMDKIQGSKMRHTIKEVEDKYQDAEREDSKMRHTIKEPEDKLTIASEKCEETKLENSEMRSKIEQLKTGLQDSEHKGSKMRHTIKEVEDKYQDAERENSKMRHTVKELEDKLTIASEKCEETKRENSEMRSKIEQLETGLQDSELEGSKMRHTIKELKDKYQDAERENLKMGSKIKQLVARLQDSEHECTTVRTKFFELEEVLAIQRKQLQDSTEQIKNLSTMKRIFRSKENNDPIQMGLDPSHQMTEGDIHEYQLPGKIGDKWRDLARALKYTEADIDSIQRDQGSSTKEYCIAVLVRWMRREGRNAIVRKLVAALNKAELRNVADELLCMDLSQGSKMQHTIKELKDKLSTVAEKYEEVEQENAKLRTEVSELKRVLTIQRQQEQDNKEQGLGNSVDAATKLGDVSGATGNDLGTDQAARERQIGIQLKDLDEKLKKEVTSLLQVPEVKEDKLKTADKLDLFAKLSESLQHIYRDIQAMVTEPCKCNEDLKEEFYDFAYHGLRAEHNDLVHRVNDLESSQAEMSDEKKKAFERLQKYQINRQGQIDCLENLWRGLFSPPESLPEASSSYPTRGNNNSKKAFSRNHTDPSTRQKKTKSREGATSAGTPPTSDEEKSAVCITTFKKRSRMKRIFRSKESKENLCHPVSYRANRDFRLSQLGSS